jgi:hypothetical protein
MSSPTNVIAAQRDEQVIPRALSRRALEVSRSWFYKWPSDGRACGSAGPGVGRFARRRHRCPTSRAGPRARRPRSCRPGGIRRGGSSSARSAHVYPRPDHGPVVLASSV